MANSPFKRTALGKGLESLLPPKPPTPAPSQTVSLAAAAEAEPTGKPLEIPLDLIDRNPFQTRTTFDEAKLAELATSIAASGVVQPIVVRPGGTSTTERPGDKARYTLITGERRLLASRKAGKLTIPAIVREVTNVQAMEMTIVENLQRADLNPMEQAQAYARLSKDFHMTQEQMADRTGKDRATIANFLRLLKLPASVQQHVASGELSFGHARTLAGLDSPEAIAAAAQKILALHLSVRATENYIAGLLHPESKTKEPKPAPLQDANVREVQDQLRRALGLKVTIADNKGRGKVVIEYSGVDDFDAILAALGQTTA